MTDVTPSHLRLVADNPAPVDPFDAMTLDAAVVALEKAELLLRQGSAFVAGIEAERDRAVAKVHQLYEKLHFAAETQADLRADLDWHRASRAEWRACAIIMSVMAGIASLASVIIAVLG